MTIYSKSRSSKIGMSALVLALSIAAGSATAFGQSCPASQTAGTFTGTYQNQGNCGSVCKIYDLYCFKIRCFVCNTPDFVYGQECDGELDEESVCLGC
jgi:hypothetical protein